MCRFPGRKVFEWLLLPLAMPAYVIAYAYTDFLEFAGPVQGLLRTILLADRDYFFQKSVPRCHYYDGTRSLPICLSLPGLVFLEQSVNVLEASRTLGERTLVTSGSVSLPAARPAIAIGASLALMETLERLRHRGFFAVYTMTAGLVDVWPRGSVSPIAQIAVGDHYAGLGGIADHAGEDESSASKVLVSAGEAAINLAGVPIADARPPPFWCVLCPFWLDLLFLLQF